MTVTAVKIQNRKTDALPKQVCGSKNRLGIRAGQGVRQVIALKRKARLIQLQAGISVIQIEFQFDKPAEVTAVRYFAAGKYGYAVCPACGYAMERDYQQHCEVCGQCLAWNQFRRGEVTIQTVREVKS